MTLKMSDNKIYNDVSLQNFHNCTQAFSAFSVLNKLLVQFLMESVY